MLNKSRPLYIQIHDIIKNKIIDGTYEVNHLLPTEKEFASKYNVSLVTIRKASELLQNENYVVKKSGKGTLVINAGVISRLSTGRTFSQILDSKFAEVRKQVLEKKIVKGIDSPFNGQPCTLIKRIFLVDNKPYIFMENYIADELIDFNSESLYQGLHEPGYSISKFNDKFKVENGSDEVKLYLHDDGPFLKRIRNTYLDNGEKIEIAIGFYNTSLSEYEFEFLTD
ncbi:MAG: GntR family transcriptional regulator [Bacilli bacterium]